MSETRSCPIMVNIEPTYWTAVSSLAGHQGKSISTMTRDLIIRALQEEGAITDAHIVAVSTGRRVPPLPHPDDYQTEKEAVAS